MFGTSKIPGPTQTNKQIKKSNSGLILSQKSQCGSWVPLFPPHTMSYCESSNGPMDLGSGLNVVQNARLCREVSIITIHKGWTAPPPLVQDTDDMVE